MMAMLLMPLMEDAKKDVILEMVMTFLASYVGPVFRNEEVKTDLKYKI